MDVTELILTQHHEQRRLFALLDDVDSADTETLGTVWARLAVLLEVHARAEEKYFYPRLLHVGEGAGGQEDARSETKDAIKDHNDIRDGVRRAAQELPGSESWWQAVEDTRIANSDHMAEEEREDLPDFRRHADLQVRHNIAVEFVAYEFRHSQGVDAENHEPESWVEQHS